MVTWMEARLCCVDLDVHSILGLSVQEAQGIRDMPMLMDALKSELDMCSLCLARRQSVLACLATSLMVVKLWETHNVLFSKFSRPMHPTREPSPAIIIHFCQFDSGNTSLGSNCMVVCMCMTNSRCR